MNKCISKIKSIVIVLGLRVLPIVVLWSLFPTSNLNLMLAILSWSIWTSIEIIIENSETNKFARKSAEDKYTRYAVLYSHLASLWLPCIYAILFNQHSNLNALIIGEIILIVGSALRLVSIATLGKFFTGYIQVSDDQVICKKGVYKLIRHPGYVGLFFINIGPAIMMNMDSLIVVIILATAISLFFRVKVEEKMLVRYFGNKYLSYIKEVPACFPRILR